MRLPVRAPGGRLCAAVLSLVLVVAGTVFAQLQAPPASASPDGTTAAGRIAYGGTLHRSMGVVDASTVDSSTPLFPDGPQHHDDEASARGDSVVFTSLRDSLLPQVYLRQGDGQVVQLTQDAEGVQHPVLSPDGQRVAFAASTGNEGGGRDIWVMNADGSDARPVTDGVGENTWPTWSPDGTQLAFAGQRTDDGGWQIFRVPADGGAVVQLTDDPVDTGLTDTEVLGNIQPAWDPVAEHDRILVTCHRPSTEEGEAAVLKWIPSDGSLGTTGVELFPNRDGRQGSWSPDGESIAFVSHAPPDDDPEAPDRDRVYTAEVAADGTASAPELRLDEDRLVATPTWYPAGGGDDRLLVTRTSAATAATMDLMDVRPDGSDPRDLGVSLRDLNLDAAYGYDLSDVSQQYSPDGSLIAFTRVTYEEGVRTSRVWIANADGSDPRPLSDNAAPPTTSTGFPAWSPDGSRIALTRSCLPCDPGSRIAVVDVATGEELYQVPRGDGLSDSQAAYSPDGQTLTFTRETLDGETPTGSHLWTVAAADGSGQRDLTAEDDPFGLRNQDSHPAYAPDGGTLALVADGRLGLVGADGVGPTTLPDPDLLCGVSYGAGTCANPTWSPDGTRLAADGRQEPDQIPSYGDDYDASYPTGYVTAYDPNPYRRYLAVVDPETGAAQRITGTAVRGVTGDDGQQVAPTWQRTSDLHTELVTPPEPVTVGGTAELGLTVSNLGPAPAPDTVLTIAVPGELLPAVAVPDTGTCDAGLTCQLGTLEPGQEVHVDLTVTGTVPGTLPVSWTVDCGLPDPDVSDNQGDTDVLVAEPDPGPTPEPTPEPTPTPTPSDPGTGDPDLGPDDAADPALSITAAPRPAYVGGQLTVTYRVTNEGDQPATGTSVLLTLPDGVPVESVPGACDADLRCSVGRLAPGASTTLRVVLTPDEAGTVDLAGEITASDTDAASGNNDAETSVRVLRPRIEAVPDIGAPGFVTSVRGTDFPPGVPVEISWSPGITADARPVVVEDDGTFVAQLLILPGDELGPRTITAEGAEVTGAPPFAPAETSFLVVDRTPDPPLWDSRDY